MRSIRVFAKKNMGDPYYEPTIVVHDYSYLFIFITVQQSKDYNAQV